MNKFCAVICYPRRQDGAILSARDYPLVPQEKFLRKPYNTSFINQACLVKMAGYWPRSFVVVVVVVVVVVLRV